MPSQIQDMLYQVIDNVNSVLPSEQQIKKSSDTVLFGQEGALDSLGLVQLIVAVEGRIKEQYNLPITLANERAMAMKNNPFKTIAALTEYIETVLKEEQNAAA